jgi:hypothetical protein
MAEDTLAPPRPPQCGCISEANIKFLKEVHGIDLFESVADTDTFKPVKRVFIYNEEEPEMFVAETPKMPIPNFLKTQGPKESEVMDLVAIIEKQKAFSLRTFGPGERSFGLVDHIRKELLEIEADPFDLTEWVDVVILALDGAWRSGHSPEDIVSGLIAKQVKNESRQWPDWRTAPLGKAIEHIKSDESSELEKQVGGDHYRKMGIYQPWIVLSKWLTDEELKGGMKSVVIPYLAREASKNGREDLEKAYHTLGIYLELTKPKESE